MARESISYEIEVQGSAELIRRLQKLDESLGFWTNALDQVGRTLTKFYSTVPFASQGGIYGVRWVALKPSYASRKSKSYPGRPVLVASGRMSQDFQYRLSTQSVRIFNPNKLFKYHQFGTTNGVPQRVMMKLDQQRKQAIADIVGEELNKKVQKG